MSRGHTLYISFCSLHSVGGVLLWLRWGGPSCHSFLSPVCGEAIHCGAIQRMAPMSGDHTLYISFRSLHYFGGVFLWVRLGQPCHSFLAPAVAGVPSPLLGLCLVRLDI